MGEEQKLQAKIQKYIKAVDGYFVKTIVSNKAGIPDILACINGKFVGIEVKVHPNKPSPLQLANIELIELAGGHALVAYSLEEVIDFLNNRSIL